MADLKLSINKDFAKRFHEIKEKAELNQLKQKFGEEALDESESSSSESEDEDARELTSKKEKDFLTVLSMIKKKDPKIYAKDVKFFHDDDSSSSEEGSKKENMKLKKPIYLRDIERKELLEKGSEAFLDDEETDEDKMDKGRTSPTYVEEQKQLKESFKKALQADDDNDDDDDNNDFLKVREKTVQEKMDEERAYVDWLKGQQDLKNAKAHTEMEALQKYWTDPKLDEDEQFLRDFILDRNYIEKEEDRIPTYEEIVAEEEQDMECIEKQEEFERKYNFRFEEPDAEFIKTYPRTIQGSVRKSDDRRKEKRKNKELRKMKEKEKKLEEIKRLKNLKRKEIMEKLEKLKAITGNPNVGFKEEDIDGDFDPKKYDKAMEEAFNQEFYDEGEEEKPQFDDDDLGDEIENWDNWEGNYNEYGEGEEQYGSWEEPHCDEPGFNMDADYDESQAVNQNMQGGRKRKGRSRFARVIRQEKPAFDPNDKTFEEYFDEYYKLDFEDIIGDLPCRYKYRQVTPNDFGLTTEEVLACPDKELNTWVSVKRLQQYRSQSEENKDIKRFRQRGRNMSKKKRILFSLNESRGEENQKEDKNLAKQGLSNERKSLEINNDSNETVNEAISNGTGMTSHSSDTALNEGETKSEPQTSDEGNTTKTIENENSKQKGGPDEKKPKEGKRRGKNLSFKLLKDRALKKKLQRQFRGAKKESLAKLSAARLASYGLEMKKKKKT
ncbi:PREDICTED: protein KRI1 homolog [Acropora digitifera]|uniref:protein KRI1 homolog n=1 Tax=Acropora digitifera TaxID=70779 RepID=UPI00077AAC70|nr:PREDICTED: protein KRI1 homolog [Acropora digitifera]